MSQKDPFVEALIRLCDREGGYQVVGKAIGVNPQTIYQINRGILLESGNPRGVGPTLRKKITERYPDWLNAEKAANLNDPTEFMLAQYGYLLRQIPEAHRKLAHLEAVEVLTKRLLTLSGQQPPATHPADK